MKPTPKFVVLRVRKIEPPVDRKETDPREWDGVLADGRRIYARAKHGAWCVRVAEGDEDAIGGLEVATGVCAKTLTYRGLKAKTLGLVLWPPSDTQDGLSEKTHEAIVQALQDVHEGSVVSLGSLSEHADEELKEHFDL